MRVFSPYTGTIGALLQHRTLVLVWGLVFNPVNPSSLGVFPPPHMFSAGWGQATGRDQPCLQRQAWMSYLNTFKYKPRPQLPATLCSVHKFSTQNRTAQKQAAKRVSPVLRPPSCCSWAWILLLWSFNPWIYDQCFTVQTNNTLSSDPGLRCDERSCSDPESPSCLSPVSIRAEEAWGEFCLTVSLLLWNHFTSSLLLLPRLSFWFLNLNFASEATLISAVSLLDILPQLWGPLEE